MWVEWTSNAFFLEMTLSFSWPKNNQELKLHN